jgi:exoribonuclease R
VLAAASVEQTESHRVIEHLMITANEQVAKLLSDRRIPTLYRVHERPEGSAVERLAAQLASLGVPTPPIPKGELTPEQAATAVGEISQAIASFVVRTAVAAGGPWSSAREREATELERTADDVALCFLLERLLAETGHDEVFAGEVVGLHSSGAFVAFGPSGEFEGMLPMRRLVGDWWELDELGTMLHGTRSGKRIRLGDPVEVQVGTIDAPRGRIDLHPVRL